MATFNTKAYGILTLLLQARFEPVRRFRIPPGCFFPEPDVESSCVLLERRKQSLLSKEELDTYVKLIKLAFSQRRKVVWKLLKQRWKSETLESARIQLNLDSMVRAQAISFDDFVALAKQLHASGSGG